MKKLSGLLIILLMIVFAGCQKSTPANLSETNAHIVDGGDPEVDGLGIVISIDNTHEIVQPINLPTEFQQKGINAPVAIKIVNTGKMARLNFGTNCRVVYLVSIRKL